MLGIWTPRQSVSAVLGGEESQFVVIALSGYRFDVSRVVVAEPAMPKETPRYLIAKSHDAGVAHFRPEVRARAILYVCDGTPSLQLPIPKWMAVTTSSMHRHPGSVDGCQAFSWESGRHVAAS